DFISESVYYRLGARPSWPHGGGAVCSSGDVPIAGWRRHANLACLRPGGIESTSWSAGPPQHQLRNVLRIADIRNRCLRHPRLTWSVPVAAGDRKSTRLNSSHVSISYAVFCL